MKKSTAIIIFIVYLASIILIGFFGMKVKAYDLQKYVKTIEMSVEAEDKSMFNFIYVGKDETTKNNKYELNVFFDKALTDNFKVDGIVETRKYVPLTLIPKVTYDTGELSDSKGESIKYSISNEDLVENNYVELSEFGMLKCFKQNIRFTIYVSPASVSGIGTGAIITVFVI